MSKLMIYYGISGFQHVSTSRPMVNRKWPSIFVAPDQFWMNADPTAPEVQTETSDRPHLLPSPYLI